MTTFIVKIPADHMNRKARLAAARANRKRGRPYQFEKPSKSRSIFNGRRKIETLIAKGMDDNGMSFWKRLMGWI